MAVHFLAARLQHVRHGRQIDSQKAPQPSEKARNRIENGKGSRERSGPKASPWAGGWRGGPGAAIRAFSRNAATRSEEAAGSDDTRSRLGVAGCCARRAGPRGRGEDGALGRRRASGRLRGHRRDLCRFDRDPGAPPPRPPSGGVSCHAGAARRDHGRPRLFPVRHQADPGQRLHFGRLRAETHGRMGAAGDLRAMVAATHRDRLAARLSGHLHRPAGRRRDLGHPFRIGAGREGRRPADQYRRFGRAGRPPERPGAVAQRRSDARPAEDAGAGRQHPAGHARFGPRVARQRGRHGAAHAGDHRPEGDPGAVQRAHRHSQRRSRPVRRGRHAARIAHPARPDLRRFSGDRGGAGDRRRRAGSDDDGRRDARARPLPARSRRSTPASAPNRAT